VAVDRRRSVRIVTVTVAHHRRKPEALAIGLMP
jgi:hypothetical protein